MSHEFEGLVLCPASLRDGCVEAVDGGFEPALLSLEVSDELFQLSGGDGRRL
jgi:hypothetical protein